MRTDGASPTVSTSPVFGATSRAFSPRPMCSCSRASRRRASAALVSRAWLWGALWARQTWVGALSYSARRPADSCHPTQPASPALRVVCCVRRKSAHAWVRPAVGGSKRASPSTARLPRCPPSTARQSGEQKMPDGRTREDFVLLYAPPWSGPTRFSKHHLARHLARTGAQVLYVEAPLNPLGLRRGRPFLRELAESLRPARRVEDRLWVRRHFLPVPYHAASWLTSRRAANRLGQRLLAPAISRDLAQLGFERPVLIAGLPHAVDTLPWLPRRALVYHCADDYAHGQGFPNTLPDLEAGLCPP